MDKYYEILGIKKGVSKNIIDTTFKELSIELKAKKSENKKLFNNELEIIKDAYYKIIDNIKKDQLDEEKLLDELEAGFTNNKETSIDEKETSNDEIKNSYGDFGFVKTNPIPINGLPEMYNYLPKLRYLHKSKSTGKEVYMPVLFLRTIDNDSSKIGSKMVEGPQGATSSPNIGENIDVFNLYDKSKSKIAKIYLHGYQKFTSKKAPKGLYLSDNLPPESVNFET
tara:strand:- start:432 stop:1106 length:675 start_codon:yes stop_codon:yes gene_type:complete